MTMSLRLKHFARALTLVGVVPAAACSSSRAATAVAPDKPTVAVAHTAWADLSRTLTLAAEFRPFQEIDVHAKVAGFLKVIRVDVGDRVRTASCSRFSKFRSSRTKRCRTKPPCSRAQRKSTAPRPTCERAESAHEWHTSRRRGSQAC